MKTGKTKLLHIPEYRSPVNKQMGIHAGITKVFNIDRKLRLKDPLELLIVDCRETKMVKEWISDNPRILYHFIYIVNRVSLASDAYTIFLNELQIKHPDLYQEIQKRKKRHTSLNNLSY